VTIPAPPSELTPGYVFASRSLGTARGVLRDGTRVVWKCDALPGHRPHAIPRQAEQCAQAERERRVQGGREVIELYRCVPCGVFWDPVPPGGGLRAVLAGQCPICGGPVTWYKVVVLEQGKAGVR
jgi:hypothetical protein